MRQLGRVRVTLNKQAVATGRMEFWQSELVNVNFRLLSPEVVTDKAIPLVLPYSALKYSAIDFGKIRGS